MGDRVLIGILGFHVIMAPLQKQFISSYGYNCGITHFCVGLIVVASLVSKIQMCSTQDSSLLPLYIPPFYQENRIQIKSIKITLLSRMYTDVTFGVYMGLAPLW